MTMAAAPRHQRGDRSRITRIAGQWAVAGNAARTRSQRSRGLVTARWSCASRKYARPRIALSPLPPKTRSPEAVIAAFKRAWNARAFVLQQPGGTLAHIPRMMEETAALLAWLAPAAFPSSSVPSPQASWIPVCAHLAAKIAFGQAILDRYRWGGGALGPVNHLGHFMWRNPPRASMKFRRSWAMLAGSGWNVRSHFV